MKSLINIPTAFRIVALFIFSGTILGAGPPLVIGQPAGNPATESTTNTGSSSVSSTADAVGSALRPSIEPVHPIGTSVLGTILLDTPKPSSMDLSLPATQDRPFRSTSYRRWRALRGEVTAPTFLLASFGPALADQVAGDPASWRGDVVGYGLRVGSNAGRQLIESGTAHGFAAATRLDLRFRPQGHGGVGARVRHAVLEAVTARTVDGARVPNAPRVIGAYGAALAQQRWQSGGVRPGDAALTTALGLGIDVAVNVITEFARGS